MSPRFWVELEVFPNTWAAGAENFSKPGGELEHFLHVERILLGLGSCVWGFPQLLKNWKLE